MMRHVGSPTVHLAIKPVDMRKSINGLSVLVADHLECNPLSGSLFVFYNKASDKIKVTTQHPRLLPSGGVAAMLESSHISTYATDSAHPSPCQRTKSKGAE